MSDADLEEIRRTRLAQLQQQSGSSSKVPVSEGGQEEQQKEADARASIISQILLPEAADRLNRIKLVKQSRATAVEERLIMLARSGQLQSKVTEDQLKELLAAMTQNEETGRKAGYVINRRKGTWDDDDLSDL